MFTTYIQMKFYLLTIKSRGETYTEKEELDGLYNILRDLFKGCDWSEHISYEITCTNRLHMHTILSAPNYFRYKILLTKAYRSYMGSRIYAHMDQFNDKDYGRVLGYIYKQVRDEDSMNQLLEENFYRNIYAFEDDSPTMLPNHH